MNPPPFIISEAKEFCEAHQYLVGTPYSNLHTKTAHICHIVVSPFDEINKNKFLLYFHLFGDPGDFMRDEYKEGEFDVLVVAESNQEGDKEFFHESLYNWVNNNLHATDKVAVALKSGLHNYIGHPIHRN